MEEEHFINDIVNYLRSLRGRPLFERFYLALGVILGLWAVCTVFFGLPAAHIHFFVLGLIEHNMNEPPRTKYIQKVPEY